MLGRRPRAAAPRDQEEVLLLRPVRREERREDRGDDEDQDEARAEDRGRVAEEPPERVAPEAAGRRLERDLVSFQLRDAQEYLILGLMIAYEMSTSRFTTTKTKARKRIPPWSTG